MLELDHCRSRWAPAVFMRAFWVIPVWLPLPVLLGMALLYGSFQASLPPTPSILVPPPGSATRIRTLDGRPVGGLQRGMAPWVHHDAIPPLVVQAFLAAEDDDFFLHRGVDLRAIVRAALVNLQAGRIEQGGSTITQQVAKMFVGTARSYDRKLVELLVARRIEATYSKWEILECYLNRVYLGAGTDGIVAAGRMYFDHSLEGLTLAEAATLAGIASAPSAFEPYDHPHLARQRRDFVLTRMAELGFISPEVAQQVGDSGLVLRERGEIPEEPMPYLTDAIRSQLLQEHGPDAWQYGALTVVTPISAQLQRSGERALLVGLAELDRRQGYRGPLRSGLTLEPSMFDALAGTHFEPQEPIRPALVERVEPDAVVVWVDGRSVVLGPETWQWAYPFDETASENDRERENTDDFLLPGDLILLERLDDTPSGYRLFQYPRLEGALASMDLDTGYLRAMVAGVDHDQSQFNRVLYGCRQPGSVFKPVIYSLALERGFTVASPLVDIPLQLPQSRREIWRPRNADGQFRGNLLLRDALIWSRNLPTIQLFRRVGVHNVIRRADALGFRSHMEPTDALSLGASCVYPIDVVTAYGVLANGGIRRRPVMMVSVVDGQGRLLADSGVPHDAAASAPAMLSRAIRELDRVEVRVITSQTAYLMTYLLHEVVRLGTGYPATALGVPVAGKTGTTTAFDAWFAGFTQSLVTAVWVGTDRNTRPLGHGETGSAVALPIWLDYMTEALADWEQGSLTEPTPPGIAYHKVDLHTGLLSQPDASGAWLPFRVGSEPIEYAPTPDQRDMARIDRLSPAF